MAFRTKPDMSAVWASLGDNTKPLDSYITNGWKAVKPPRQYFNWLDNRQDSAIAYLYQAGIVQWDALTDYEGGAGVNSYVQGSDGKVYVALADSGPNISGTGTKDPTNPANSAFWEEAFAGKGDFDSLETRVDDLETGMTNGSGVTNAGAWRTALVVDSSSQVDTKISNAVNGLITIRADGFVDTTTPASPSVATCRNTTSAVQNATGEFTVTLSNTYAVGPGGRPLLFPVVALYDTTALGDATMSIKVTNITTTGFRVAVINENGGYVNPDRGFTFHVTGTLA